MRKYFALLAALVMAGILLTACGGEAPAETATEAATTEAPPVENKVELTDDDYFDIVFADAPVQEQDAQNVDIRRKDNGTTIFSFTTSDGDYVYTIDANTGEILERVQPDTITTSKGKSETLSDDELFDRLAQECPVDYALGNNLKIKRSKDKKIFDVTFDTEDGDYYYSFDAVTGELLDKTEPDNITEKSKSPGAQKSDDPIGQAIDACCSYADVSISEAEDIHVSENGDKTEVSFHVGDKKYDLVYDTASGKVEEK